MTTFLMTSKTSAILLKVGARFAMLFAILFGFALLTGVEFAKSFVALLWMAMVLCAAVATLGRDQSWTVP